jgi:hypothetical protein
VVKKERGGGGEQKHHWGIEMNHAQQLYLAIYTEELIPLIRRSINVACTTTRVGSAGMQQDFMDMHYVL